MSLLVVLLPLIASLIVLALRRAEAWIATLGALGAFGVLAALPTGRWRVPWLPVDGIVGGVALEGLGLGLRVDGTSWLTGLLVAGVAAPVIVFSHAYVHDARPRYFAWMGLFVAAMLALVLADDLLTLFVGWELVGLASWALIAHERNAPANTGALEAFVVTRTGDLAFLLALVLAWLSVGSLRIDALVATPLPIAVPILLVVAAAAKSAQLPLTAWLAGAMEGPAPVSGLLHAATMVAAGAYLLIRLFPVFPEPVLLAVAIVGACTAVVGSLAAAAEYDAKRILAWSTASQLGEMWIAVGLLSPLAALAHLFAHATFKAPLFLVSGAVQHRTDRRDLWALGGMARQMPAASLAYLIGALTLIGLPPLSAFWSGERIMRAAHAASPAWAVLLVGLLLLGGVYIGRAWAGIFLRWPGARAPAADEMGPAMAASVSVLVLAAAGLGGMLYAPMEAILPFEQLEPEPEPEAAGAGWGWKAASILAGPAGFSLGVGRVMAMGPVPAFGVYTAATTRALQIATAGVGVATMSLAARVAALEGLVDGATRLLAQGVTRVADGVERAETGLDRGSRGLAGGTFHGALLTDHLERAGFDAGGLHVAGALGDLGSAVRRTQNGKLYLYAMSVFVWVLATGGVVALLAARGVVPGE